MRLALPLGLAALICAVPASAYSTSTVNCRSADRPGLQLDLVTGWAVGPTIAQAYIVDGDTRILTGDREPHPKIAQSWYDDHELRVQITDWYGETEIARLRANSRTRGGPYVGSFRLGDRSLRIRCLPDGG